MRRNTYISPFSRLSIGKRAAQSHLTVVKSAQDKKGSNAPSKSILTVVSSIYIKSRDSTQIKASKTVVHMVGEIPNLFSTHYFREYPGSPTTIAVDGWS